MQNLRKSSFFIFALIIGISCGKKNLCMKSIEYPNIKGKNSIVDDNENQGETYIEQYIYRSPKEKMRQKLNSKYVICNKIRCIPKKCVTTCSAIGCLVSIGTLIQASIYNNKTYKGCYPGSYYVSNCRYKQNHCCDDYFENLYDCIYLNNFDFCKKENNEFYTYKNQIQSYCNNTRNTCDDTNQPLNQTDCNIYMKNECSKYMTPCKQTIKIQCDNVKFFKSLDECKNSKYNNCEKTFEYVDTHSTISIIFGTLTGIFSLILLYIFLILCKIPKSCKKFKKYIIKEYEINTNE